MAKYTLKKTNDICPGKSHGYVVLARFYSLTVR